MSAASRIVVSGVRSSCETSETNRCCTSESSASSLICGLDAVGHRVERAAEGRELVFAPHREAHAEVAGGELRASAVSAASPIGIVTERSTNHEIAPIRRPREMPTIHSVVWTKPSVCDALRGQVVQLVAADVGNHELLADDDPRHGICGRRDGIDADCHHCCFGSDCTASRIPADTLDSATAVGPRSGASARAATTEQHVDRRWRTGPRRRSCRARCSSVWMLDAVDVPVSAASRMPLRLRGPVDAATRSAPGPCASEQSFWIARAISDSPSTRRR